jgi:hypothetical protein
VADSEAGTGESWIDAQARLGDACYGTNACSLPSGRQLVVVYVYENCGVGSLTVYDSVLGDVGGTVGSGPSPGLAVSGFDTQDLDALSGCIGQDFTPTSACGIVGQE